MGRRPITDIRPPTLVSCETGAAELDMSQREFRDFIGLVGLPPLANGMWRWTDIEAAAMSLADRKISGRVYFIACGRFVKIGYTTNPVSLRLAQVQTGAPERLRLITSIDGTRQTERELHERFADLRSYGEWFRHEGELAAYIAGLSRD